MRNDDIQQGSLAEMTLLSLLFQSLSSPIPFKSLNPVNLWNSFYLILSLSLSLCLRLSLWMCVFSIATTHVVDAGVEMEEVKGP